MSPLRRLFSLSRHARGWLVLATLAAAGTLIANILLMAAAPYLISRAAIVTGFAALAVTVTAVRAFAITRVALRYVERHLIHLVALRMLTRIRVAVYRGIERVSPGAVSDRRGGDVLARLDADVTSLDDFFVRGIVPPVAAAAAVVVACTVMWALAPTLAVVLLVFISVAAIAVPVAARAATRRRGPELITTRGHLHAELTELIDGLGDLVALSATGGALGRVAAASGDLGVRIRGVGRVRAWTSATGALVVGLAGLVALWFAIPMVREGDLQGVLLAVVPLLAFAAFEGVLPLADAARQVEVSRAAAVRTFELTDAPPAIAEPSEPLAAPAGTAIAFRDVTFAYPPAGPRVLQELTFDLAPGDRLGIVGPSGAGKTTLIDLLLRFHDPTSGRIELAGHDVRGYRADDVRALIGVVPQHPYLFNATLRDNLLLADGEADDETIARACERASLGTFVEALPEGLDTPVGEQGLQLSGGERQRVAIARLFLRDAPIAILDEATANLDPATDRAVLGEVDRFSRGKTLIVVSHRPEALTTVDRTLRLG